MAGGLFQAQADFGLGILLSELEEPFPKRFGTGVNDDALALAGGGVDEMQIGFAIGTIQADDEVIGMRCVHEYSCELIFAFPQT